MRKVFGLICIILGICCILSAAALVVYNQIEASRAGEASDSLLQDVNALMLSPQKPESVQTQADIETENTVLHHEMLTAKVDGYDCVGVLASPVLELELPVLTDWSYEKLKLAPCHYFGNCSEPNFVIAAHNYESHFGRLKQLLAGDLVLFTDIAGNVHCYEVVLIETLAATATEEMLTSGFDLSLYTCTPGGASRVTARCKLVS